VKPKSKDPLKKERSDTHSTLLLQGIPRLASLARDDSRKRQEEAFPIPNSTYVPITRPPSTEIVVPETHEAESDANHT
jgi:hypothetical protein